MPSLSSFNIGSMASKFVTYLHAARLRQHNLVRNGAGDLFYFKYAFIVGTTGYLIEYYTEKRKCSFFMLCLLCC